MTTCERIQEMLSDLGREGVDADPGARDHLAACPGCAAIAAALVEVDASLRSLPLRDAPEALVAAVAARATSPPAAEPRPLPPMPAPSISALLRGLVPRRRAYAAALAGTLMVAAVVVTYRGLATLTSSKRPVRVAQNRIEQPAGPPPPPPPAAAKPAAPSAMATEPPSERLLEGNLESEVGERAVEALEESAARYAAAAPASEQQLLAHAERQNALRDELARHQGKDARVDALGREADDLRLETSDLDAYAFADAPASDKEAGEKKKQVAGIAGQLEATSELGKSIDAKNERTAEGWRAKADAPARSLAPSTPPPPDPAQVFLAERASLEGLTYIESSGYWANTYVPGDPAMRFLEARLGAPGRAPLRLADGRAPLLERGATTYRQPFDAPGDAALAVYIDADRRGIDGPTRFLVQVGLKGTPRQSGSRPPMNIAVVLDLRGPVTTETASSLRALLVALAQERLTGDRFSLFVAGRPGGCLVAPADFKYGPLTVAVTRMLGNPASALPRLDLPQAMEEALARAAAGDDPKAPLGASLVLLVTPAAMGGDTDTVASMAHRGAVNGVSTSVIALGPGARLDEVDRITLAGQGRRSLLVKPDEAASLVDRELHALSRVIARALRLRIRLAPGVKLHEILGSERLTEERAQRVREAEKSVDLRLARSLGIAADRGEDEEGIQIVLPAYYAGDEHVVLLDVVAERPGPIADVTARYKDLVYLRNGVARANLTLADRGGDPGPLARAVLKNAVARRLAGEMSAAARLLAAGDPAQAAATLRRASALASGLRRLVPGWASDPELATDARMTGEYAALIESGAFGDPARRREIYDSLRYAAFLKTTPRLQG